MKYYFLMLAIAAGISTTSFAQQHKKKEVEDKESKEKIEVPSVVKSSFSKKFPGNTAKWEKENGMYEAGFKHQGKEMSAMFEANGTMTESEMEMKVKDLPVPVLTYVKSHFKGRQIEEAARITKANGEVNYEAEVSGKDLIFDSAGKFIKEALN